MAKPKKTGNTAVPIAQRQFDARPDTVDFRNKMYVPTLVEVFAEISLDQYRSGGKKSVGNGND